MTTHKIIPPIVLVLLILTTVTCGTNEYYFNVSLKYCNETDSTILFTLNAATNDIEVELAPHSCSQTYEFEAASIQKRPDPTNCCQDALLDVYGSRSLEGDSQTLVVNDIWCVVHRDEKSVDIANYLYEKISDRHYMFTYNFQYEDFAGAALCE